MAWRLADSIIEGFFCSPHRNSCHGSLLLAGMNTPIMLSLTGNPDPMLQGRAFDFRAKDPEKAKPIDAGLALHQIGATGEMKLRMVKIPRIPIEEWDRKSPLECDWELCLYLEWYSQNGRVVIELVDPVILLRAGKPIEVPEIPGESAGGFSFSVVELKPGEWKEGEADFELSTYSLLDEDEEEEDGDDLESYFDKLNREREAALRPDDDEEDDLFAEIEGEKFLRSQQEGEFISSLLQPQQLPPVDDVDEEQAETLVKCLLTELALHGVAVHLCEHCDMREAYSYLLETVLREGRTDPSLKGLGWVTGYHYGEHCPECIAEIEILENWRQEGFPPRDEEGKAHDEDMPF